MKGKTCVPEGSKYIIIISFRRKPKKELEGGVGKRKVNNKKRKSSVREERQRK